MGADVAHDGKGARRFFRELSRCEVHGVKRDARGQPLHEDRVKHWLWKLALHTGHPVTDAAIPHMIAQRIDLEERRRARIKKRVMLGRYARQPMSEFDHLTPKEIDEYLEATIEVVQGESEAAGAAARAQEDD